MDIVDIENALRNDRSGKSNFILVQELLIHTRISLPEIRNLIRKYCKGDYDRKDETLIVRELHNNQKQLVT